MTPILRNPRPPRGSALLMVLALLAVLGMMGVAAVRLGSQERINASAKGKRDMMAACADAARMMIWAELAKHSTSRLRAPLAEARVTLADGTVLSAPSHYAPSTGLQVTELSYFATKDPVAGDMTVDCTNSYCPDFGVGNRLTYAFVARCVDRNGRSTEVEFDTMLMF